MKSKKILFVTQEIHPFVPESAMTLLGKELPLACMGKGDEIRAFMPKWGNINERRNQLHEVIRLSGMNIIVDDIDHTLLIKVASVAGTHMQVYFIDNEDFFGKRLQEADEQGVEYPHNFERSVFYSRGVLETVKKLRWSPNIIHAQGWTACAMPFLLKTEYADDAYFRKTRVVYTVNPNKLTLQTGGNISSILGEEAVKAGLAEEFGESLTPQQMDLLAIKYADGVTFTQAEPDAALLQAASEREIPVLIGVPGNDPAHTEFLYHVWELNNPNSNE